MKNQNIAKWVNLWGKNNTYIYLPPFASISFRKHLDNWDTILTLWSITRSSRYYIQLKCPICSSTMVFTVKKFYRIILILLLIKLIKPKQLESNGRPGTTWLPSWWESTIFKIFHFSIGAFQTSNIMMIVGPSDWNRLVLSTVFAFEHL